MKKYKNRKILKSQFEVRVNLLSFKQVLYTNTDTRYHKITMSTEALFAKTNTEPVSTYSQSFCASTPWTIQSEAVNNPNETITVHTSENQQTNENLTNSNKPPLITRRQLIILLIINFSVLSEASCYSILAPFFPEMAEKKHLTSTQYGFVFGIFHLVLLVSSPIIPKLISFVNAKFLVNAGIFFAGGCSVLFGILDLSPPGATFLTLCLVVRMLEAFGTSAMFIISYTIIGKEFNERRATALATIEMSFGLGITIGPSVGGILYQFNLQPSIVGLFFFVSGGCYAIGTLCWGHISDKVFHLVGDFMSSIYRSRFCWQVCCGIQFFIDKHNVVKWSFLLCTLGRILLGC